MNAPPLRRCVRVARAGALVAAVLACAGPAASQVRITDPEDPSREQRRFGRELERGVRESDDDPLLRPERRVTYEDVLRNPDDVDINFAWAQVQIGEDDLKGAAATLERILLRQPNLPRVRLLLAAVLFRLGRLVEAEQEFTAIQALPMDPALRAEVQSYQRRIRLNQRRTRYAASASVGMQYDWNRNAAPRSGNNLFLGQPFPVAPDDRRQADWSLQLQGRGEVSHDLGVQQEHRFNAAIGYIRGEQAIVDDYDLQVASVEAGMTFDFSPTIIQPLLYGRQIRLANQRYGHAEGIDLRVEQRLSKTLSLYGFGEAERQRFNDISPNPTASTLDGPQFVLSTGIAAILDPAHRVSFEVGGIRKKADVDFSSYTGPTALLTHTWLLGDGAFLLTSAAGEIDFYDAPELFVSPEDRRDTVVRFRSTFGVPVGVVLADPVLANTPLLRDLDLYVFGEWISSWSTIENYSYENWRWGFGLVKRWEF